jgi:Mycothiol maleylpyruvate isomerase N-terminal domain
LELLRGLSPADWERPTECPAWTVQQLALHVLGDDLSLLARQRDATPKQGLILYAESHPGLAFMQLLDGFNEQWVTASTFLSPELLIALLGLVGEWSDDFYRNVGLDTLSREPVGFFAQTDPSPYWQIIAREYAERVIHQSQLRRAVGAPELDGEIVTCMARVVVHATAHWLADYRVADGVTIGLDLGTVGSWTWRRDPGAWSVVDGIEVAHARITVAPDHVVALLTRGMARSHADAVLTVGGDEPLARGALAVVAPLLANS